MNLSVKKKPFIFFAMVGALCDVPKFLQYILLDYAVTKPIYHTKVMPIDLVASLKMK